MFGTITPVYEEILALYFNAEQKWGDVLGEIEMVLKL